MAGYYICHCRTCSCVAAALVAGRTEVVVVDRTGVVAGRTEVDRRTEVDPRDLSVGLLAPL